MATHSSTLAWKIPWLEEPGGLQSMGSLGVRHDWATSLSLFTFIHWRRKWHPTPVFLPGESQGQGSLVGCSPWDWKESTRLSNFTFTFHFYHLAYVHPRCSKYQHFIPLYGQMIFHCEDIPQLVYPFISWLSFTLFPPLGSYQQCWCEYSCSSFCVDYVFISLG